SFFGALIGAAIIFFLFSRRRKIDFLPFADFVVTGAPIALFFGRLGNFLNLEIPGRVTDVPWGMYFPDPSTGLWELRHPSQLYEALAEGIALFLVLSFVRRRNPSPGIVTAVFLAGYAIVRFFIEFFREPDPGTMMMFGWMTVGQTLSIALLFAVIVAVNAVAHRRRT
ncbi:MAG: prolipoprotein diacylglyceryl transferase, partial [Candidatus Moraniibacteriota bacterium]